MVNRALASLARFHKIETFYDQMLLLLDEFGTNL